MLTPATRNVADKVGKVRFSSPVSVARRQGVFYVADSGLGAVIAFDDAGKLRFTITNHLQRPTGVAVGGRELFVADSQRHVVAVFEFSPDPNSSSADDRKHRDGNDLLKLIHGRLSEGVTLRGLKILRKGAIVSSKRCDV